MQPSIVNVRETSKSVLFALCLLIVSVFMVTETAAQPARSGASSVRGRVVYKDNEQPLKKARLRIFSSVNDGPGGAQVRVTNERGEFQVDNLAAGKYYVILEGPGVATPSGFGMRLPLPIAAIPRREDYEEIVPRHDAMFSVDGTNAVEVEVRVARGGTISGKVMKGNGEPAAFVVVSFLSRDGSGGPYMARFSAQADKNGAYTIENIPAGEYLVAAATENTNGGFDLRARLRDQSQVVTYHPAAITARDAMSIRVDPGGNTGGVNITFVARNSFAVSGTVLRQHDGTPLGGATVLLRNKELEMSGALVPGLGQRTTQTDADGRWSFANVIEGSYAVIALAPRERPERLSGERPDREQMFRESRQRFLVSQEEVNVIGADVVGLSMTITGPGLIVGRVETDNDAPLPTNLVIFVDLSGKGIRPGPPMPVRVKPDGTFNVAGIQSGDYHLGVALAPDSRSFIKSVTANGADLYRSQLRIVEGADAGPVRVVLAQGAGSIAGRVVGNTNQELSGFVVVLAPVEPEKQRFRTSYLTTRVSPDGSFSLTGAPGEYFAFARQRDNLPAIVTEDFVKAAAAGAQRVELKPGEQTRLELRQP